MFINGRPRGRIKATRVIRQGDHLSPFLFLIISELLGAFISQIYSNGLFEGFLVGQDKVHLSILQFADDTLLFCKYDDGMLDSLIQTDGLYEWCLGQKVNWEKSGLYGVNIEEDIVNCTATRLKCQAGKLPFLYLGLPLGRYPKQYSFWQPIIDKVNLKLDRWKRYNLSRGSRLTLCNSVLANLPTYCMSIFQMPVAVSVEIERIMCRFCWEGLRGTKLNHLAKWDLVTRAFRDGGLGIGNLKHRNSALLFKWNFLNGIRDSSRNRTRFGVGWLKVYMVQMLTVGTHLEKLG